MLNAFIQSYLDWTYYRALFPVTDGKAYFMTAGAGPIAKPVLDAICQQYTKVSERGGNVYQENIEIMEACRIEIAKLINATPQEIAFIPNVSFGMNAIAHSFKEKTKVVIPDVEFPSSSIPWLNTGYEVDFIPAENDLTDNLVNHLTNKAIIISSLIQYASGYVLDLPKLLDASKTTESFTIINATQCISTYPIDVKQLGIDVLICACHKWMFCGEGIAFMYINKNSFQRLKPALVGWRSSPHMWEMSAKENRFYDSAIAFELGWPNSTIFAGFRAALNIVTEIGIPAIYLRIKSLMNYLVEKLYTHHIPVISNTESNKSFNILLLGPFPDLNFILTYLNDHKIYVTKRGTGIRVALHFYNNEQDIDRLITALIQLKNNNWSG